MAEHIEKLDQVREKTTQTFERVEKAGTQDPAQLQGERFENLMERKDLEAKAAASAQSEQAKEAQKEKVSLFEQVRKDHLKHKENSKTAKAEGPFAPGKEIDRETLLAQIETTVDRIQRAREGLSLPNARVPGGTRFLLRNRLSEVNNDIRAAVNQAGLEYTPPPREEGFANPIKRFLGMLGNGQSQLQNLGVHIKEVAGEGGAKDISPGKMLMLQYRMHKIQHQVEIFTALLNKGLESVKTIMNVQI